MTSDPAIPPEPFRLEVEPHRSTIALTAHGELDIATAETLRAKLHEVIEAGFRRIVLDLRAVSFIDSSGLRAILAARTSSSDAGVEFALIPGPEPVQRLFEITGTERMLRFLDASELDRG